jgi:hypothetical protein
MPLTLTIQFTSCDATAGNKRHCIRHFAENLERALAHESAGQVQNPASAVTFVLVTIESRRTWGRALAITRRTLHQHHLLDEAVLGSSKALEGLISPKGWAEPRAELVWRVPLHTHTKRNRCK